MTELLDPVNLTALIVLGLIAGTLGGLLGVGGSVVIIPGLALVFGSGSNQHLYQAAAMTVNVAVALPAARRHHQAQAVVPAVLKWMLPAAIGFIVLGVLLSNLPIFKDEDGGQWLGRLLALFLIYVIYLNLKKLTGRVRFSGPGEQPRPDPSQIDTHNSTPPLNTNPEPETLESAMVTPPRAMSVGGIMGLTAGLMGVGGGALAVPLQQTLLKLPLRNCIANSSAVMVFSAAIGATLKVATLPGHGFPVTAALGIAAVLGPTAILGARIGAGLTHTLPIRGVRVAFVLLMIVAMLKMAAIPGSPI